MKKIKALRVALVAALCAATLGGISALQPVQATEITAANDLFVNASGVTVTQNAAAPDQFKDYKGNTINRDFDLGMSGVKLTAEDIGAKVDLSPTFSGDFSMTFRAYSDVSFGSDDPREFNKYSYAVTPYADLREISFIFEAEDGKSFTVAMLAGEKYNVITPAARVILGRMAFGYHYSNDATLENNTINQNAGGYYTRLSGTTFCNVAMLADSLTSKNSKPVTFGYNAAEKEIYVMHYGRVTERNDYRVVADLDNLDIGLYKMDSFDNYKVSVQFTDIAAGKDANIIVYDINGQSLAGDTFTDNMGAQTSVQREYDGVKDQKYYLPTPGAFDLFEGQLAFNGTVSVNNGAYKVYNKEGEETTVWSEGCYFTPTTVGECNISYTAKDGKNNSGNAKTIKVNIYNALPEWSYAVEGDYTALEKNENTYSVGASIPLYPVKALSNIFVNENAGMMNATLLKGGAVYKNINNQKITEATNVTLDEAGEYTLVYSVAAYPETMKKTYTITVSDTVPAFNFTTQVPQYLQYGATFSVPKVTAQLGGVKTLASSSLYAPDGSLVALSGGKTTINSIGTYKIVYKANLGGASYTHVEYFQAAHSNNNVFEGTSDLAKVAMGDSGTLFPTPIQGVKMTFIEADKPVTYTRTIDLSKLAKDEPLIKLIVLPSSVGALDFWQYTIRLTDIYDAKNYVDIIVFKGSWGNQWSYVRAGASNQKAAGWEMGKVLTSYNAGAPIFHSFTGESQIGTENIVLYYDYADSSISVDNIKRAGYSYGNEVIDLDGTDCFSENNLFKGFTTGEVSLTISVQDMQQAEANILVTEICGIDFSKEWLDDTVAPRISVDTKGYAESELPVGLAGVAYPIFQANAFDVAEGTTPVSTKVYKEYQTLDQTEVNITDGKFTPDAAGTYTIIYKAADKSGNSVEKTLKITVKDSLDAFNYTFNKTLTESYYLGEYLSLPSGAATGGSGKADATVKVFAPDGTEIAEPNGALIDQVGTYKVQIDFVDFLGRTGTQIYSINASVSSKPIVYKVSVPEAMINGVAYTLPDFEASDYSTGSYQAPTKSIIVTYKGQDTTLGADRKYTPNVSNHQDTLTVTYRATNADGAVTDIVYNVTVLVVKSGNAINMLKYFKLENMTENGSTASYVEFLTATDGARLAFVNPLIANNINISVFVPKAYNNFNSLTITMTDSKDSNIAKSFTIEKNSPSLNYSIMECEGEKLEIAGNFFDLTSYGFSVRYNNTSKYLFDNNGHVNLIRFTKTDAGETFTGFPSGKVYVSMTLNGVTGESAVRVMQLANQNFSNVTEDRALPQIQLSSFIARSAEINQPFVVPSAIAADVLTAEVTLQLTIKRGSKVLYTGSIDEDYSFTPTDYGKYRIEYKATAGGRSATSAYFVDVKDRVKPVLTLNGTVPGAARVGKAVTLPTVTISDNYTAELRVWIYITEPTGRMITLEEGVTTWTPEMKGKHRISYYVEDEYANYTYSKYTIRVI